MKYYKIIKRGGGGLGFTMTVDEIIRFLQSKGFMKQVGGRHQIHMVKGKQKIPVPSHTGTTAKGTVKNNLKAAGYKSEDVMEWRH
jgi:predicted RNA binding protein YcfA (HicA-like mRNA interferase family)